MVGAVTRWFKGEQSSPQAEFERYISDSYTQSYAFALKLTGNATDAEDLLQESYLRAFRFLGRYDRSLPFLNWFYRIMINVNIDAARKRNRITTVSLDRTSVEDEGQWEIADETNAADKALMADTLDEDLERSLRAMNPDFRISILLADVEGFSYEEVAEIMGTSVGTVRSRIHRGRKLMRDYLEEKGRLADFFPGGLA